MVCNAFQHFLEIPCFTLCFLHGSVVCILVVVVVILYCVVDFAILHMDRFIHSVTAPVQDIVMPTIRNLHEGGDMPEVPQFVEDAVKSFVIGQATERKNIQRMPKIMRGPMYAFALKTRIDDARDIVDIIQE